MTYPERDYYLAWLLDLMAELDFAVDLTLTVRGVILSGTPIPEQEFFDQLGGQLAAGFQQVQTRHASGQLTAVGGMLHTAMAETGAATQRARQKRRELLDELEGQLPTDEILTAEQVDRRDQLARHYIYLKDVTFWLTPPHLPSLPLWRGRLSEVEGWSFGRFTEPLPG